MKLEYDDRLAAAAAAAHTCSKGEGQFHLNQQTMT